MTDDHGLILINVREWDDEQKLPEYEDVLEFLKFVHNYVIPIYGTKNMRKWIKNNPDKTVITKVTATSIAYAVLVYESRYKVWEENIAIKNKNITRAEMRREKRVELPMYHTAPGTKLKLYEVGWTSEGRDYYATLSNIFQSLKSNQKFWDNLSEHWVRYESEVLKEDLIKEAKNQKEVVLDVGHYDEEQYKVDFMAEV